MRPDDRVVVGTRPDWHEQVSVNVIGRVRNPGCYTLLKESGLKELFQAAGGMLPDADSAVCYLNRPNFYGRPINPNLKDRLAENQVFNPAIISLDFGASGKKAAGVRLEDGDTVFVPRKTGDVSVVGRVALPGLYPYKPGKSWAYYIDQAGGFDQNAYTSKSKIYKKDMEAWVFAKRGLAVDAGDVIVVPERPHDYYWNKIKDAITITSGIISIMATYLVLTR